MKLRAALVELWTNVFPYDVSKDIFSNGNDDQASKRISAVIANSPTGIRARNMLSSYISGSGLTMDPEMDDFISLWDVVVAMGDNIATQGGVWVHRSIKMNEEGELVTAKIKVLDYHKCRIGKKDDDENDGKVWYGDFSAKKGYFRKSEVKSKWFYSFNAKQNVIEQQIIADAKEAGVENLEDAIAHYRGQVLYINTTPENVYAVSPFDSVYNDMDTEYRISLYGNKMFRSGFLGKTMVLFSGLNEDDSRDLSKNIKGWLGSENSDNIYLGEVESAEDVEKSLYFKQLDSQYDDDMSQNTEKRITRNILGAARNIPETLLFADNSLFGTSGESIIQMKKFYSEQTKIYRTIVEKNLRRLGYDTKIIEL